MRFLLRSTAASTWIAIGMLASAAAPAVVINEIHYEPLEKTKPLEFVELFNAGTTAADLSGWRFAEGIQFTFPPETKLPAQGYVVVSENPAAFQKEYGFAPAGRFTGRLSNRREKIELLDAKGATIDRVVYGVGFPWPSAAAGGGPSIELINATLSRAIGSSWRSSRGPPDEKHPTPGARNSAAAAQPPPGIQQVQHAPEQPKAGDAVAVHARVSSVGGLRDVTLRYQIVEPGAYIPRDAPAYEQGWIEAPMHDDGWDGDGRAGDNVFTAMVPQNVQRHRRLVRYRIAATDTTDAGTRVPYADDDCPNFAYFVYNGAPAWTGAVQPGKTPAINFPAQLMATLPAYHLLAVARDVRQSQWEESGNRRPFWGTFVADGRVYDHIRYHNRGQASMYGAGKNKWAFRFNRAHDFAAHDRWGRAYPRAWDDLKLDACASPWVQTNRGMAGLDEAISFRIYELAGVPSPRTHPVQLRVIDEAEEAAPGDQYRGDLWGLYLAIEEPDGSFLDDRGLPDGNVFRIGGGGGDLKHHAASQPADGADWNAFSNASRRDQPEGWWRANLDLPAFYSFHACNRLTANVDLRNGDNHYFYHRPDGRWSAIPWDLDMMFIPRDHQSGVIDQDRCLELRALRLEYQNRCRELLDLLCADATPRGGQIGQVVDEYVQAVHPAGFEKAWPELDECLWNFHPQTRQPGMFYRNPVEGGPDGGWTRTLATPDFFGFAKFIVDFCTDARRNHEWKLNDGEPRGYGYGYVRADSEDRDVPERPTIQYRGEPGFPANELRFQCSLFGDPQGAQTFAGMQWRLGEIAAPSAPGQPWRYEIEQLWTSPEIAVFTNEIQIPPYATQPGRMYRARVRMKDQSGRWSRWSEAAQFVAGALRISR